MANRTSAVKAFISFAVDMDLDYKRPGPEEICAYIELLISRQMTPKGIRAHISSLKGFYVNGPADSAPFDSLIVRNALRAVDITLRHTPKIKQPLHPTVLARMLDFIDSCPNGRMVSFCLSLMFTALLRQSNLIPTAVRLFDPDRQLTCDNVIKKGTLIYLDLKWTKTNQRFGESTVVSAPQIPNSSLCPVSRYVTSQSLSSRLSTLPLIRFPDGNPMTVPYVTKRWKQAIEALKVDVPNLTLHRLRLSGASWANSSGASTLSICQQGTWRTDAFRSYIASFVQEHSEVNRAMSAIRDGN